MSACAAVVMVSAWLPKVIPAASISEATFGVAVDQTVIEVVDGVGDQLERVVTIVSIDAGIVLHQVVVEGRAHHVLADQGATTGPVLERRGQIRLVEVRVVRGEVDAAVLQCRIQCVQATSISAVLLFQDRRGECAVALGAGVAVDGSDRSGRVLFDHVPGVVGSPRQTHVTGHAGAVVAGVEHVADADGLVQTVAVVGAVLVAAAGEDHGAGRQVVGVDEPGVGEVGDAVLDAVAALAGTVAAHAEVGGAPRPGRPGSRRWSKSP